METEIRQAGYGGHLLFKAQVCGHGPHYFLLLFFASERYGPIVIITDVKNGCWGIEGE